MKKWCWLICVFSCFPKAQSPRELEVNQISVGGSDVCTLRAGRLLCTFPLSESGIFGNLTYGGTHFCAKKNGKFFCFSKQQQIHLTTLPETEKVFYSKNSNICAQVKDKILCMSEENWHPLEQHENLSFFSQNILISCSSKNKYLCCSDFEGYSHLTSCNVLPKPLIQIDAKKTDVCGRTEEGDVFCIGIIYSSYSEFSFKVPVQSAKKVAVGNFYGCAITSNGVFCWKDEDETLRIKLVLTYEPDDISCDENICCVIDKAKTQCWSQEEEQVVSIALNSSGEMIRPMLPSTPAP
jgi:hypothetical protein